MENKVKLSSQDGLVLEVQKEVAIKSHLISTIIEDTGLEEEIPLPNVKFNILKKVMQYCEMHKDDNPPEIEKPLRSTNMAEIVDQKDADFIDIGNLEELFDIILAANYLDIKSLLELSCAKVATFIKNKTPEEIRKTFNIQNDLTQEEEQQIREENKWAEETS
ncbi:suppressor of kinetochore protein mutant [Paramecium bursaria]